MYLLTERYHAKKFYKTISIGPLKIFYSTKYPLVYVVTYINNQRNIYQVFNSGIISKLFGFYL